MSALLDDNRSNDMCPICKTDRYLSPNMTFLINPECYHKICESCVDRIFSLGPAKCPYPKCNKMLRKNRFKKQVFDDIKIEREVDMRKRIHSIYNKSEEDFSDLKEYNAYLEYIENLIFNLANGFDVEKTEEEITKYENEHKIEILERAMRESEKDADITKYQEATERLRQEKLKIQRQMELEDMEFQQQQKQELMERLSSSDANAEDILKEQRSQQAKRISLRKKQLQQISNQLDQQFASVSGLAKNGKDKADKTPFTPFQGDRDLQKRYSFLGASADAVKDSHDAYYDPYVNKLAKNREYLGSGWRIELVLERALDEAFMGLNCFIEKEKQFEVTTV